MHAGFAYVDDGEAYSVARDGMVADPQLPPRPVTMPVTDLPIARPQVSRDGGAPDFGRRRNPDASAPRGRTHIASAGRPHPDLEPDGTAAPPFVSALARSDERPGRGNASARRAAASRSHTTRPSPHAESGRPHRGLFGPTRLGSRTDVPIARPQVSAERWGPGFRPSTKSGCVRPPRADAFRVRGAATPGFGARRDCRTPLRLRARALQRTARPRQCLGSSGRGLRPAAI